MGLCFDILGIMLRPLVTAEVSAASTQNCIGGVNSDFQPSLYSHNIALRLSDQITDLFFGFKPDYNLFSDLVDGKAVESTVYCAGSINLKWYTHSLSISHTR